MRIWRPLPIVVLMLMLYCGEAADLSSAWAEGSSLEVATFSVDVTPPLGVPVGQGFVPVLKTAEHPLLARGILLRDRELSCVLCALDLTEVHNDSYDFLREAIARAAEVSVSRVALHALHQHTAPAIDIAAQKLELPELHPRRVATAEYLLTVAEKLTAAIRTSRKEWQSVSQLQVGRGLVERVASSRRLEAPDGSIIARSSSTRSAAHLRELPEGLIDPWVRSVSFGNAQGPIVQLHYYASHPQSFYRDGRASYDVPGLARERLEAETGVFQIYLTGCGGDVAFGKYNDGSMQARSELTERLLAGMRRSLSSLTEVSIEPLRWSVERVAFPLRGDAEFSEKANRRILADGSATEAERRKAALAVAWIERVRSAHRVQVSCLSIGRLRMLHLPGEPFVQYQLKAQELGGDNFVCVAGYGDCGMGYIGGDRIYTDRGGYEQTYAFAGPCEELMIETIRKLLAE